MSKLVANSSTHSSLQSYSGSLGSPPQNSRPKIMQNGSSWTQRTPVNRPNGKDELHLLDPDEVFAKHTVSEVKTILHRLRSDVDAKQEELRLMVGERYRDLLQASTSIISMSQSSRRVLDSVGNMKRIVSMEQSRIEFNGVSSTSGKEDSRLQALQCLAAHLKLLLDASEHLWRLLERKRYLHAAWLFLLSRLVFRSLVNEDSEEGQNWVQQGIHVKDQFPLVQRQWESVSQFRAQISHKATLSLREQTMTSQELCASILALHLLDSLPLTDALDVFLKQRSKSLQNLHAAIRGSWDGTSEDSPKDMGKFGKKAVRSVWDDIQSVLDAIAGTVGSAREAFKECPDGSPPMIGQVLAFTQTDVPIQPTPSIPSELCLSTHILLSSLPNSNHFLPLPPDIRSYRPFVDLGSHSSTVNQSMLDFKLRDWFKKAAGHLRESAGPWLTRLETIKKVWKIRSSAIEWLSASSAFLDEEDTYTLRSLIDSVCKARVKDIWKADLVELSSSFEGTLRSLTVDIAEKREGSEKDISPAEFLLSAPPTPSVTQASLGSQLAHSSFQRFKHAIKSRIDSMTPFIDKIMSKEESAALRLRSDLDYAFADEESRRDLEATYTPYSEKTAGALLTSVENLLNEEKGESEQSLRRLIFIGRVAQKLSLSSLISDLRCSAAFSDECHARARLLYDLSVDKCASSVVLSARDMLFKSTSTDEHALLDINRSLPSNPSPFLMDALLSLAGSAQSFGLFRGHAQRSAVVKTVLDRLSAVVAVSLQDLQTVTVQFLWDLCFLKAICDDWGSPLTTSTAALKKALQRLHESLPPSVLKAHPNLDADLQSSVVQSIIHVRLLLSPLVAPIKPPSSAKSPRSPTSELNRQKAASATVGLGIEHELQPALNVVKPSSRFGSLWVGTAAAR